MKNPDTWTWVIAWLITLAIAEQAGEVWGKKIEREKQQELQR